MRDKDTWFIRIWDSKDPDIAGIGECGPLPGLSPDRLEMMEDLLEDTIQKIQGMDLPSDVQNIIELAGTLVSSDFPSVRFGLETAILDFIHGGKRKIFENGFFYGKLPVPINGLIWMNEKSEMIRQASEKIADGFNCIKMKIGAIKFDEELEVLKFIRGVENNNMTLRVDANGAFSMAEVFNKLDLLARYRIHSIEQPIKPGSWESMAEICRLSPIPIALDEELIGMSKRKEEMLDNIQPQFIVLKPTLLGGFKETGEWIDLAEKLGIGWWITSMLESNIGLNAITQFAAGKAPKLIHGLGTGKLYSNNVGSPLSIQNGEISYLLEKKWDYSIFPDL